MKTIAMCLFLVACGGGVADPEPNPIPQGSPDPSGIDFPSTEPIAKRSETTRCESLGGVDTAQGCRCAIPGEVVCRLPSVFVCECAEGERCYFNARDVRLCQ